MASEGAEGEEGGTPASFDHQWQHGVERCIVSHHATWCTALFSIGLGDHPSLKCALGRQAVRLEVSQRQAQLLAEHKRRMLSEARRSLPLSPSPPLSSLPLPSPPLPLSPPQRFTALNIAAAGSSVVGVVVGVLNAEAFGRFDGESEGGI